MSATFPWCWQHRPTLQLIRDKVPDIASGLAVYVALTEMASEFNANPFKATQNAIAIRCGLGVRTVTRRLADLESAGVIRRTAPPGPVQSDEIELLDPTGDRRRKPGDGIRTLRHDDGTPGHDDGTLRHRNAAPWPNPIHGERNQESKNPRRPSSRRLSTPDRIALGEQRDDLKATLAKVKGLRHYEEPNREQLIADLEARLGVIESQLADHAQAIAGGDR